MASIKTAPSTAKNAVISPNFLVWKFCGKAQFPHRILRSAAHNPSHFQILGENKLYPRIKIFHVRTFLFLICIFWF